MWTRVRSAQFLCNLRFVLNSQLVRRSGRPPATMERGTFKKWVLSCKVDTFMIVSE